MNPILSMVAAATSVDCRDGRAVAVLEGIRSGRWRDPVEAIRAEFERAAAAGHNPKEAVGEAKKRLPGVLWSGRFEQRRSDKLTAHSGLLCLDLDDVPAERLSAARQALAQDPHVFGLFLSPTGTGLKAVLRVPADAQRHGASFEAGAALIRQAVGLEADGACKDLARLCFVSFDPDTYINRDASELPVPAEPTPQAAKPLRVAPTAGSPGNGTLPRSAEALLASGAEAGRRNVEAFALACQLRDAGKPESEAEVSVLQFAARCTPALATREALAALRSAYSRGPREPARANARPAPACASPAVVGTAPITASADETTFLRLAALSPAEYDRCREAEAEQLRIRVGTLDAEVARRRPSGDSGAQGTAADFPDVEPWPEPVGGCDVLDAVSDTFSRYVALPPHAADAVTLWVAAAHAFEAFIHAPRLNLCSPEKGCGKTTLLDVLAALVPRPLKTENLTPAVLFRIVERYKPTLLLDEVDSYLADQEELRGLLNAGHRRGARAYRCEGESNEVRCFAAFAPAALAGIGALPGTLHDRSIVVRLVRAKAGEVRARFDSRRTEEQAAFRRMLARWASDNQSALAESDPAMPDGAVNRVADNWRPLFAVAELAEGGWRERAERAFRALSAVEDLDAQGLGTLLLGDLKAVFATSGSDRLPSSKIVEELTALDNRPWPEYRHAKPITPNQLARMLSRFDVRSRTIRWGEGTAKGYLLEDFTEAFDRYLAGTPLSKRNSVTTLENKGDSAGLETSHAKSLLRIENPTFANTGAGCYGVTDRKGGPGAEEGQAVGSWGSGEPVSEPVPGDVQPVDEQGRPLLPEYLTAPDAGNAAEEVCDV